MKLLFCLLLSLFSLSLQASGGNLTDLQSEVDAISNSSDMKHAQWTFVVSEVQSGKMLLNHNGEATLLPASTLKTVTSAAAIDLFGPSHRFQTTLEYDGEIVEGVLQGNLYIRGGGDPALGSDRFGEEYSLASLLENTVKVVRAKGIERIDGKVIADASVFGEAMLPNTWIWSDVGNYYGSGPSGLTISENTYHVFFKPHAIVGKPAEFLRTEPELPGMVWANEMRTGSRGSGDQGYIYGAPYTDLRYLRGTIPQGKDEFSIKGSLPDPASFAAQVLHEALLRDSIEVAEASTSLRQLALEGKAPKGERTFLWSHASPTLKEIVYWLNKKSVNLFAEHLLRHIGLKVGKKTTTESGAQALGEWWKSKGVDTGGMHLYDGSGLSRSNGITGKQLAAMLRYNAKQEWFGAFYNSLPIAGKASDPGSLRRMCTGTAAANNLRAKSGYISRVRGYTGYVDTQGGTRLAFAMLANNFTCSASAMRRKFEKLMVKMAELN